MTEQEILAVEKRLGYTFRDRTLLVQAFTRTSYVNEKKREEMESNQVLEFFGDSVLSCAIVTLLIRDFSKRYKYGVTTKFNEGDFSVMKSHLSDKTNLSKTTATLGFGRYLLLGEGDKKEGIDKETSVLEDLYESIIGAIWIDSGNNIDVITRVVENTLDFHTLAEDLREPVKDLKSQLQEYCQDPKRRLPLPKYIHLGQEGEQHRPTHFVECRVGTFSTYGQGKKRETAEKVAAEAMLALLIMQERKQPVRETATQRHPADTPMSILKRISDKRKVPPSYKVEETPDGGFITICTYGSHTTKGEGRSKQESKQASALRMLEILGIC